MGGSKNGSLKYVNIVIALFEMAALFYNTASLKRLGYLIILVGTGLMFFDYMINKSIIISTINLPEIIFLALVYLISIIFVPTFRAVSNMFSLLISIAVLIYFSQIDLEKINIKWQKYIVGIQLIILFTPMMLGRGFSSIDSGYKSIFTTTTFVGLFSCISIELCVLCFLSSKERIWEVYIIAWIYLVWCSKVRTALLGVLIVFLLIIIFKFINKKIRRSILKLAKWILFASLIIIIVIYPQFDRFPFYEEVSNYIYIHTGKIFFSGRNEIWIEALNIAKKSPLLGYGLDYSQQFDISVHNSYLNILLQTGILGIFAFLLLINNILNTIIKKNQFLSTILFIFAIVNLLISSAEVMLLQGQLVLQLVIWCLFGIKKKKKRHKVK